MSFSKSMKLDASATSMILKIIDQGSKTITINHDKSLALTVTGSTFKHKKLIGYINRFKDVVEDHECLESKLGKEAPVLLVPTAKGDIISYWLLSLDTIPCDLISLV